MQYHAGQLLMEALVGRIIFRISPLGIFRHSDSDSESTLPSSHLLNCPQWLQR
ncbi:hypothetical protein PHLCEN_2v1934 [Hermanssonia centrifuga]|uniref:Uncharacterized protein n=1 Tax=Hermanssonia centrifuga TaxID=98765 RepID=A0A2R6RVJ8_9APHY|nr:hypothetical protein PHLCEN_2v1934 [Hermanssonia centrifuga]